MLQFLDSLEVEKHWLPGVHVNWKTGDPDDPNKKSSTHCSAFAAAVCDRLGIYLLRPPEHSTTLLANAQYEWLQTDKARDKGWSLVASGIEAQRLANQGLVVLAVCKNPDDKKPGHIAIIRPSTKDMKTILAEGPDITQAGRANANCTSLKNGFKNHKGAFEQDEIRFFVFKAK